MVPTASVGCKGTTLGGLQWCLTAHEIKNLHIFRKKKKNISSPGILKKNYFSREKAAGSKNSWFRWFQLSAEWKETTLGGP